MDSITFEIDGVTIYLSGGKAVLLRFDEEHHKHRVELPIDRLMEALSTAKMLRKDGGENA